MSLKAPNLDTRTFKDLVDEARARIPRYTPDWTNLNDSDPGMTLVKLQAWLTETLLYQLNRVPELNYIKFLELLNVKPLPATAAQTELTFKLKQLNNPTDPLVVLVPKNTQAAVDDPDLTEEVVFETDYTLTAINAVIAAIMVKPEAANGQQELQLITEYDKKEATLKVLHAFYPFSSTPVMGDYCLIGVLLRPHRKNGKDYSQDVFPAGQLDVTVNATEVFEKDNQDNVIKGPFAEQSRFPWELSSQAASLEWEVYVGTNHSKYLDETTNNQKNWRRLNVSDETAGLQDSGHVRLEIPDNISDVSFHKLPRTFWSKMGLKKPPVTINELIADLEDQVLDLTFDMLDEDAWIDMGVPEAELNSLMSCCNTVTQVVNYLNSLKARITLDPSKLGFDYWIDLDAGYDDPSVPSYPMAWLRVISPNTQAALINNFLLNTVPATAAITRLEEQLDISDGRPAQSFTLAQNPVYYDPQSGKPVLELEVVESGQSRPWTLVSDFYRQGPDSEVFLLDEATSTITFGDGIHGRIPVAGAQIVVRRYRYGGGAQSNAGEGSVTKLKSVLPSVDSVTNVRAAAKGQDVEDLEETKLRASHELRSRERAVSAEDFALLAKQTPGVAIQRAYALARRRVNGSQKLEQADGAVTVVILPLNDQETPQPSEAQLRAVCNYLNPRRLITTELYATGPRYKTVKSLQAEIRAESDTDLKAVKDAAFKNLLQYFHPLYGSEDGKGWPFGGDIFYGNVYQLLLGVLGIRRVLSLSIELEDGTEGCTDSLSIPEGHLVHLPPSVIDLKVTYDNFS